MSICAFDVKVKDKSLQGIGCGLLFIVLSVLAYATGVHSAVVSYILGLLACIAGILTVASFEDKFGKEMDFLAKYTMPIFLMHTLFAAPMRSVLLKIGIESAVIHMVLGLGVSFIGPIIVAQIMKKTKWLEVFLYPNKFVNRKNST